MLIELVGIDPIRRIFVNPDDVMAVDQNQVFDRLVDGQSEFRPIPNTAYVYMVGGAGIGFKVAGTPDEIARCVGLWRKAKTGETGNVGQVPKSGEVGAL